MRKTQSIPLASIDIIDRLRPINPDRALLLAAGMAEEGLKTPVEVRKHKKKDGRYILVTGGHRLEAARLLGWTEIEAEILVLFDDQARLREINENLYRADLTELDRAVFLAEKKRIYEKLHPETKNGGDRRSDQMAIFGQLVPRFTTEVAERLGYSERTLRRVIARAALPADVRSAIAGTSIANTGSELDALLRLPIDQQRMVARALSSDMPDAPKSVAAAHEMISGPRAAVMSKDDAALEVLMKAWRRATAQARQAFVEQLADEGRVTLADQSGEDA